MTTTRTLDYTINTAEGAASIEQGVRHVLCLALDEFQAADRNAFVLLPLTQGVTNIRKNARIIRAELCPYL